MVHDIYDNFIYYVNKSKPNGIQFPAINHTGLKTFLVLDCKKKKEKEERKAFVRVHEMFVFHNVIIYYWNGHILYDDRAYLSNYLFDVCH